MTLPVPRSILVRCVVFLWWAQSDLLRPRPLYHVPCPPVWLPMIHTFSRNRSLAAIKAGKYGNIRGMMGDSQHGATSNPWMTALAATADGDCAVVEGGGNKANCSLFNMAAACYYFAESLTDMFEARGETPPTIGLVSTAIGGEL